MGEQIILNGILGSMKLEKYHQQNLDALLFFIEFLNVKQKKALLYWKKNIKKDIKEKN